MSKFGTIQLRFGHRGRERMQSQNKKTDGFPRRGEVSGCPLSLSFASLDSGSKRGVVGEDVVRHTRGRGQKVKI